MPRIVSGGNCAAGFWGKRALPHVAGATRLMIRIESPHRHAHILADRVCSEFADRVS